MREDDEAEEMNELKTIEPSWATKASFVMMSYLTKASTASSLIDIESAGTACIKIQVFMTPLDTYINAHASVHPSSVNRAAYRTLRPC